MWKEIHQIYDQKLSKPSIIKFEYRTPRCSPILGRIEVDSGLKTLNTMLLLPHQCKSFCLAKV